MRFVAQEKLRCKHTSTLPNLFLLDIPFSLFWRTSNAHDYGLTVSRIFVVHTFRTRSYTYLSHQSIQEVKATHRLRFWDSPPKQHDNIKNSILVGRLADQRSIRACRSSRLNLGTAMWRTSDDNRRSVSRLEHFTGYAEFIENCLLLRQPHRVASVAICLLSVFTSHECSGFVSRSHCSSLFFVMVLLPRSSLLSIS